MLALLGNVDRIIACVFVVGSGKKNGCFEINSLAVTN